MEEHIQAQIKRAMQEKEASLFKGLASTPTLDITRPTLKDRLKRKIEAASQEKANVQKSNELFNLLEKNPEVARILELIEDLQA